MNVGWTIVMVITWAAMFVGVIICLGLNRRVCDLEARGATAATQNHVAPFPGTKLDMEAVKPAVGPGARWGEDSVILFLGAACAHCDQLVQGIRKSKTNVERLVGAQIIVVTNDAQQAEGLGATVVVESANLGERLGVRATPVAVAINHDGLVLGSGVVTKAEDLADLVPEDSRRPDRQPAAGIVVSSSH